MHKLERRDWAVIGICVLAALLCEHLHGQTEQLANTTTQSENTSANQPQVKRDADAVALLTGAWNMMGGSNWRKEDTKKLSGTITKFMGKDVSGPFTIDYGPGDKEVVSMSTNSGKNRDYAISNGSVFSSVQNQPEARSNPRRATNSPIYEPLELLRNVLSDTSWSIENRAQAASASNTCVVVHVKKNFPTAKDPLQTQSKFTEKDICVNKTINTVDRIEYTIYSSKTIYIAAHKTMVYSDYSQIGSYFLPSQVSEKLEGNEITHLAITSVQ